MDLSEKCTLLLNSEHSLPSDYVVELETVQEVHQVDKDIAGFVRNMLDDAKAD